MTYYQVLISFICNDSKNMRIPGNVCLKGKNEMLATIWKREKNNKYNVLYQINIIRFRKITCSNLGLIYGQVIIDFNIASDIQEYESLVVSLQEKNITPKA